VCPWVLKRAQCRAKQPAAICAAFGEFATDDAGRVRSRTEGIIGARSATNDCVKVHKLHYSALGRIDMASH
jgi:hypothetical protein